MNQPRSDDEVLRFLGEEQRHERSLPPVRDDQHQPSPSTAAKYRRKLLQARVATGTAIVSCLLFFGVRIGWRLLRDASNAPRTPVVAPADGTVWVEEIDEPNLRDAIEAPRGGPGLRSERNDTNEDDFNLGDKFERALQAGETPSDEAPAPEATSSDEP